MIRITRGREGFSLVEVLISLLISSLVLLAVTTLLGTGITAYHRLDQNSESLHQTRIFFRLLETQLRNTLPYAPAPFKGEKQAMQFISGTDDSAGTEEISLPRKINYVFKNGALYVEKSAAHRAGGGKDTRKLLDRLKEFSIAYAYYDASREETVWLSEWPENQGIPRGIKVTLLFRARDRSQTESAYTKHYYLPQGNWGWLQKALS